MTRGIDAVMKWRFGLAPPSYGIQRGSTEGGTAEVAGHSGARTLDRLAFAALPLARHQAVAR